MTFGKILIINGAYMSVTNTLRSQESNSSGFHTPPRTSAPNLNVQSPDSKHFVKKLANEVLISPEKRYLAEKPKHTVIYTSKPSPLKDAEKIRRGLAEVKERDGTNYYSIHSNSTPNEVREYKSHSEGSSKRIIPSEVRGGSKETRFLSMKGASVLEEVTNFQKESPNSANEAALFKRLQERNQLDQLSPSEPTRKPKQPKPVSVPTTMKIPRQLLLKENKRKTPSSEIEAPSTPAPRIQLYPDGWVKNLDSSNDEPEHKKQKVTH
jgi:hypothetical protein